MSRNFVTFILFLSGVLVSGVANAQSLGRFRWQLEPYCNIVSVTVTPSGDVFRLEGTDDQCGAGGDLASAIGTAFLNPDGTVGIGLNVVSAPGGAPVHVDAAIDTSTLGGTWRDSAGNSGNLVFRTGAGSGGTPRPTTGAIGASAVNANQVQLRVEGSCVNGTFMQGVAQNGTVSCGAPSGVVTSVNAGSGLVGSLPTGAVTLGLPTTSSGAFRFTNNHGFVSVGTFGSGQIPMEGAGTRAMWYPAYAAFRAGYVSGTQWDKDNIGQFSVAFGLETTAKGDASFAMGNGTHASGGSSVAFGRQTTATGASAVVAGGNSMAFGDYSLAVGVVAQTDGDASAAIGRNVVASGDGSIVLGTYGATRPAASGTFVFADRSTTLSLNGLAPNQFLVRAAGGTSIYSNAERTAGVTLAAGGSAWGSVSDVNMKENFRDLTGDDVLVKIARMPIREWNYKAQDAAIRHVGPTAQDFHAAFGLGEDPLRISTIDADGIALRAIQALEARTREQNEVLMRQNEALGRQNDAQQAEIARLRGRLDRLETQQR